MRTRIKVCCIASIQEAMLAVQAGADALGLVGKMPSGPGVIADDLIAHIAASVPPGVETFLLSSETTAEGLIAHHRRCRTTVLQIVDRVEIGVYAELRRGLPGVKLVQVIHVSGPESGQEALAVVPYVDAVLLDSGNQNAAVKELGGTGRVHDWRLSRQIVEQARRPVYLAGGLTPVNVGNAVGRVRPFGVDVCSGVRTGGKLDEMKLRGLIFQVRQAEAAGVVPWRWWWKQAKDVYVGLAAIVGTLAILTVASSLTVKWWVGIWGGETLAEYIEIRGLPEQHNIVQRGDKKYLILYGPTGSMLASGPAGFVFDDQGKMVDWTWDLGDDGRFVDLWDAKRGIGQRGPMSKEALSEWSQRGGGGSK
jgi:phosphoribosylanthranilate isomerase